MRGSRPVWLPVASLVYQLCSWLTPRRVRERFGAESEDAFRHLIEDTLRSRGSGAAITTAAAACGDVARAGVAERLSGWCGAFASGVTTDVRQAIRIYWREPILATAIALSLALVAGPAVAIYSVLYDVVLAPLPYPDSERLISIVHRSSTGVNRYLTAASVSDYRAVEAFSMVGGVRQLGSAVAVRGQTERHSTFETTSGLLAGLGVPFAAGRDLQRGEPEVVVTPAFALSRFGSESAALGQALLLNDQPMTIVGVLAYRPPLPGPPGIDLFVPHRSADGPNPGRQSNGTFVIARLRPDADIKVALEQAEAVAAGVRMRFPGRRFDVTPELASLRTIVSGSLRAPLLILSGAVAVVFLIAVTSLASLVLARAASRAADVAVRTSLGASRWQLVRSWLIDGSVLALPGIALGAWLGGLLLNYARASMPAGAIPIPDASARAPMMLAAIGLGAATGGLFALAPIAAGLLRSSGLSLRDATRSLAGLRRVRFQSVLVVGQVALSVIFVTSAVWLSTSLWRMLSRPLGFDSANLVTVQTRSLQPRTVQADLVRRVLTRLRQLDPGAVDRAAVSSGLPGVFANMYGPTRIRADWPAPGEDDRPTVARSAVSPDYLRVLGVPLLQGRHFTAEDEAIPDRVIIVSRSFAVKWFPEGALGQAVTFGKEDRREVIGVVEEVHASSLSQDSAPQVYVPRTDPSIGIPSSYVYVVRTPRSAEALRADVTAIVRDVDPTASVAVMSADEAMDVPIAVQRVANQLSVGLALVALLLAVVNVYALSAFAVVQRTREIGIRMALGARSAEAMRLVMRRGLVWIGTGLVVGGGVTVFFAAPLMQARLFETQTTDPGLLALGLACVTGIAVASSWLPARRAARIDPAITLRAE